MNVDAARWKRAPLRMFQQGGPVVEQGEGLFRDLLAVDEGEETFAVGRGGVVAAGDDGEGAEKLDRDADAECVALRVAGGGPRVAIDGDVVEFGAIGFPEGDAADRTGRNLAFATWAG